MIKSIIFCLLLISCTIRSYDVNFHYYVGNNGYELTEKDKELIMSELKEQSINIPPNSGNLTIYIQAEVPKHIQAQLDAEVSTPLLGK